MNYEFFNGTINTPTGFYASGVSADIKKTGDLDLAIIASNPPATSAGIYTKNIVKGHSLIRTMKITGKNKIRGLVINSGNANACLGEKGDEDAEKMAEYLAEALSCSPDEIITGSTGVIGHPLPMQKIQTGIHKGVSSLTDKEEGGHMAASAIMTTDIRRKESCVKINIDSKEINICGMAKGSGMIFPDMATMIAIITTDCNISQSLLQKGLKSAADKSFNRICVDGDTSVCDMVIALANGGSENKEIVSENSEDYKLFLTALKSVCIELAKLIASDGEGATKLIQISVEGAAHPDYALSIARAISKSPLVKTAFNGEDANWGRILTAAGYSGAQFNPDKCDIYLGGLQVCKNGQGLKFDEEKAKKILSEHDILVRICLNEGDFNEKMWTCDFSKEYININGSYRS